MELKAEMPKRGILSCNLEETEPTATAANKVLAEGGGGFSEGLVQPSLTESSLDIVPEVTSIIDFSHFKPSFDIVKYDLIGVWVPIVIKRFLEHIDSGLSGVSFLWEDIFKDPLSSKLFDVSHIPQPIYEDFFQWIDMLMESAELCCFVMWTFNYITDHVSHTPRLTEGRERFKTSNVSIFVALAMILRTKPNVLYMLSRSLKDKQLEYQSKGIITTPLIVWMIDQVSQVHLRAALYSWAHYLLPLLHSNPHSNDLILQLAEKTIDNPEAKAKAGLLKIPDWYGTVLIPAPSFEILMRLRFPASEEDTARFARIYNWLKDVVLASAAKTKAVIKKLLTVSLKLAGEGNNPVLAEEAAAISLWCLTENLVCWEHWYNLCKENLKASVALLKELVERWNDHSLRLASKEMEQQFIPQIFTVSLRLAGQAEEAAAIAIWSLTENIDCWKSWDNLYKENIEASVALLKQLVEKWNDPSLKLLSSPSDTLILSQTIKSFRLKNKRGNNYLYKEADKSCKVISWRVWRQSPGSSSLKGICIVAVILVTVVAVAAHVLSESVFGFYN